MTGVGLWTPGYASAEAWCCHGGDPTLEQPRAGLLEGALRRRSTRLTRMGVEVLEQALGQAGCDPATVPSVWATSHGEHSVAIKILEMMWRGEGRLSPMQFHNSVHNTASGYASIACGNSAPSTTLTGGAELVASSLLEAICRLHQRAEHVVVVLADEPLLPPFDRADSTSPLALAFCLSARPERAMAVLSDLRRDGVAPVEAAPPFAALHVAAALPLLEGVVCRRGGTVPLELANGVDGPVGCVDLETLGA